MPHRTSPQRPLGFRPSIRHTGQRWCIDPALLRDPEFPEPFESAAILDEVGGDLGLLLWHTSRDVLLWAAAGAEQRSELFAPGALAEHSRLLASATDRVLHDAVEQVVELLRSGRDEGPEVTECCETVSEWAVRSGLERTAIAFAQAGAAATPADPAAYVRTGRLMLTYRRRTAAETWFRRGIALARRASDWPSYAEAWVGLGWLHDLLGDSNAAGWAFKRAAAVAKRKGLGQVRARAHHGMMRVTAAAGDYETARRHGRKSLWLLRDSRERRTVVHDLASVMLREDPQANAVECSTMLRAVLPLRRSGAERIATLTLLVSAAGYAGQSDVLSDAWFDAVRALDRLDDSREAARMLLDLARSAGEVPGIDSGRIGDVARRAVNMAARVGDRALAQEADAVRQELRHRVP